MKALTLTQPWASLVARGYKQVETRSWTTSHRGALAIHAAKGMDADAREMLFSCRMAGLIPVQINEPIALGMIVATARLMYVEPTEDVWRRLSAQEVEFGDFSPGRYAWFLGDVEPLAEPVPARGALGLWEWTALNKQAITADADLKGEIGVSGRELFSVPKSHR